MTFKSEPPEPPHSSEPDAETPPAEPSPPSPMVEAPPLDAAAAAARAIDPSIDAAAPSPAAPAPEPDAPEPDAAEPTATAARIAEEPAPHPALEWLASLEPAAVETKPWPWPWVTIVFAIANVLVWGYTVVEGVAPFDPSVQSLFEYGGNLGAITLAGEEWRLFTALFVHSGFLHLAMNMVALVIGGSIVEQMYGRFGFAALYLISGLGASLATAMRPGVVSVGASGAIFGVLGAAGAYALVHRDRLDRRMLNAGVGLVAYAGYHLLAYFQYALPGGGVFGQIDMHAHLGGLAVGFACGLAMALVEGAPTTGAFRPRIMIVGVIFLGAVIAGAVIAPPPFDRDVVARRAVQEFARAEERVVARWRTIGEDLQSGRITEDQLAEMTARDVVPPWRAARGVLEASEAATAQFPKMLEYARAREEGWELLVEGLRAADPEMIERGRLRLVESDQIAGAMRDASKTKTSE